MRHRRLGLKEVSHLRPDARGELNLTGDLAAGRLTSEHEPFAFLTRVLSAAICLRHSAAS